MKQRKTITPHCLLCVVFWVLCACNNDSGALNDHYQTSTDTGSISFRIVIESETPQGKAFRPSMPVDCGSTDIDKIEAAIYDPYENLQARGGPWDCTSHKGTITNVPIGGNKKIIVLCKSPGGTTLYQGEHSPFGVDKGLDTDVGTIAVSVVATHTITAGAGDGGSISPSGDVAVEHTADRTFTIAADPNHKVEDVIVDGNAQGAITEYTFRTVRENHTISATFVPYGRVKWSLDSGVIHSSPAIGSDGTIYAGSMDGKLYLLNPDGTQKAVYPIGSSMSSSAAIHSDGTIYIGANNGYLYAVNPDGTPKWKFQTNDAIDSSPAIGSDGTVYIGSDDDYLYALNPDGSEKWRSRQPFEINASPVIGKDGTIYAGSDGLNAIYPDDGSTKWVHYEGGYAPTSAAIDDDGTLYAGFFNVFTAVHPDGAVKWQYRFGNKYPEFQEDTHSSPAIGPDGTIYFGTEFTHLSSAKSFGELQALNSDGTLKWSFPKNAPDAGIGPIRSSPAIASDGTVYVGSDDGSVYAVNPDGTELWRVSISNEAVRSSPVIGSDGTVYIGSSDGRLYAIISGAPPADSPWPMFRYDPAHTGNKRPESIEGTYKWSTKLGTEGFGVSSSPAIDEDGTIYIGSYDGADFYAINPDGAIKWRMTIGTINGRSPSIASDGTVYIETEENTLFALNANGNVKWRFDTAGSSLWRSSLAIGSDGTIYICRNDNNLCAVNPGDGTQRWAFPTGGDIGPSPSIGNDGTIYVCSGDGYLYAINPDGSEKWRHQGTVGNGFSVTSPVINNDGFIFVGDRDGNLHRIWPDGNGYGPLINLTDGNYGISSPPAIDARNPEGTLYVGTTDGKFHAMDIDDWRTGPAKWSIPLGSSRRYTSPAISNNGTIYIGSDDKKLYAIDPDGTQRWAYSTQGEIFSSPAIGSDGTVYVASSDGYLYAINGSYPLMTRGHWPMFKKDLKHTARK